MSEHGVTESVVEQAALAWFESARGAIDPLTPGKTRITIRLDDEILRWFKDAVGTAGGGNYQTLINDALREYIHRQREPLEDIVRRVLREEMPRLGAIANTQSEPARKRRRGATA